VAELKETPQLFGRHRNLVGLVTERAPWPHQGPAVIILNAGLIHRVGPSRVAVDLARFLAQSGYRVLRFDLSGIGDSVRVLEAGNLADGVRRDITDAIDFMDHGAGVILLGLCSGADNAFCVAGEDPRVRGLVLVDPAIHSTAGYRARRLLRRLISRRSWWSLLSGRAFALRYRRPLMAAGAPPPGFFGLLTLPRPQAIRHATVMSQRGVEFLYILTGGVLRYCNYPGQVSDSLRGAIPESQLEVDWRPDADHMLTREEDRVWLRDRLLLWLMRFGKRVPALEARGAEDSARRYRLA
jgi:pimeloyl-ACP methyl ester carboxylesterase